MIIDGSAGGIRTIRAPKTTDYDFDLVVIEKSLALSQSSLARSTFKDSVLDTSVTSDVENQFSISTKQTNGNIYLGTTSFTVSNGNLVNGVLSRVADGACIVTAKTPWLTKQIILNFLRTNAVTTKTLVNYVSGSLAKHIVDATNAIYVTGKDKNVFSYYSNRSYVRNTNCWMSSIDWTSVSSWNSEQGIKLGLTAITPRHVITVAHWGPTNGMQVDFVTAGNATITRTIISQQVITGTDIRIMKLDSDLPNTISIAKFAPANLRSYLPSLQTDPFILDTGTFLIPALCFDGEKKLLSKSFYFSAMSIGGTPNYYVDTFANTVDATSEYTEFIISGDSGHPIFLLINNEPVLICQWSSGWNGTATHDYLTEINASLTSLGGGYQLTQVNLSGFTAY